MLTQQSGATERFTNVFFKVCQTECSVTLCDSMSKPMKVERNSKTASSTSMVYHNKVDLVQHPELMNEVCIFLEGTPSYFMVGGSQ